MDHFDEVEFVCGKKFKFYENRDIFMTKRFKPSSFYRGQRFESHY